MNALQSANQDHFSRIPAAITQRSKFDRSFTHKTTFDADYLIPFLVDEALPGDTFHVNATILARLATPIKPIMDNSYLEIEFWGVPNRLIWDNFKKFMGEQKNPGDSISFVKPVITNAARPAPGDLLNYMGVNYTGDVIADFTRAYNLIYNTHYRDQNLQNSVVVDTDDGPDSLADYVLLRRGKKHDYATSALPFLQKGAAVTIPLGSTAPVISDGTIPHLTSGATTNRNLYVDPGFGQNVLTMAGAIAPFPGNVVFGDNTGLITDLSTAVSASINMQRNAVAMQQLLELYARGGTRYPEIIYAEFGVISDDARQQRPEYLGGSTQRVGINPIAQSSVSAATPQGNLAATGTVLGRGGFSKSFTEHTVIIGLCSVRSDLTYQDGTEAMWFRSTRYDYFHPMFANLGEQPIYTRELWHDSAVGTHVFGYQERDAPYRYKPSLITGLFNSFAAGTLDVWHLSQKFASEPLLNAAFIVSDTPFDRVIAVPSEPHFIADIYTKMICARPMPVYSIPGLSRF